MSRNENERHRTMAYSFIEGKEVPMSGSGRVAREMPAVQATPIVPVNPGLAPTEEMPAMEQPATVQSIVSHLIEQDVEAWRCLPTEVRNLMLAKPNLFTLVAGPKSGTPNIRYGGVELRYDGVTSWVLASIRGA